jgi:hypothetical protein
MSLLRAKTSGVVVLVMFGATAVALMGCSKKKPTGDAASSQPTDTGSLSPGRPESGPTPQQPKFNFDVSKLGYNPARPDQTIPVRDWPRRSGRGDTGLLAYNGKVIATEGRIYGFHGSDRPVKDGPPAGQVRVWLNIFDADGNIFGDDGRAVSPTVNLAAGTDWKKFRPGQVVKVVGRGATPEDAPTSLGLKDAVVLSVTGEGDPPMTTAQLSFAARNDPKKYAGGFTSDRSVTLTGVVSTVPKVVANQDPEITLTTNSGSPVVCTISNWDDFRANPPKTGDSVTIIGKVNGNPLTGPIRVRGLYLSK